MEKLEELGLLEMQQDELQETEGGFLWGVFAAAAITAFITALVQGGKNGNN